MSNRTKPQMDLMILEVDGSLTNPFAAGAVAVWAVFLSAVAVTAVQLLTRSRFPAGSVLLFGVFGFLVLITRLAQDMLGQVLYSIVDLRMVRVGFWGGPPVWIAPTVGCLSGFAAWVYFRRKRLGPTPPLTS